jgi:hypothetical protein
MEDDVYFYGEQTIHQIDAQYPVEDLLCPEYSANPDGNKEYWHWRGIEIRIPPPYYNGMMCAVRFSHAMIDSIHAYATSYQTLFFLEALFPTLAMKNSLKIKNPHELSTIVYRAHYKKKDINRVNLYHPVKDMNQQLEFKIST